MLRYKAATILQIWNIKRIDKCKYVGMFALQNVCKARLYNSKFYVVRFAASKRCENSTAASPPLPPSPHWS